jgi:predicted ATPase
VIQLSLAELSRERRELGDSLKLHEQSLERFWPKDRCWFALEQADTETPREERSDGRPHHLTSSASCYEALADKAPAISKLPPPWVERMAEFARGSLSAPIWTWRSEGAAEVYCRVRALPAILRFTDSLAGSLGKASKTLVEDAWSTVDLARPDRGGLAERSLYKAGDESRILDQRDSRAPGYPPNGFLTYWGLRTIETYDTRRKCKGQLPELSKTLRERERVARAWAAQTLAKQTALVLGGAEQTDPQQLAYALACDLRWGDSSLTAGNSRYELYQSALQAFFRTQLPSGMWPQSEPLFHYPESGNAYCFTYETLTELLRPALPREDGRVFRELLSDYLTNLLAAWHHARTTRVPLDKDGAAYGWSSGHHAFRQQPEAWATAAVYSFSQMLRCIVGHFAVDAASEKVRIRRPKQADPEAARELLARRGRTWSVDGWTVGRQLASLFLNPRQMVSADPDMRDPDTPLIPNSDARSAILFGPPGTGKTTLVEALAGALGWRFVEVQAADFLSAGVDAVPARAEEIFEALMELDRCVVLFDEIDELIRQRDGHETDPFGRFLTTSMLPKIAQLWDQGRVLFFVATNHVAKADPAIRRSSRFDAAILVAPPSLPAKREELAKLSSGFPPGVLHEKISEALEPVSKQHYVSQAELPLGVVALLRHDQISELADRFTLLGANGSKPDDALSQALMTMADDLLRNEWRPDGNELPEGLTERLHRLFAVLRAYQAEERNDRSRRRYVIVVGPEANLPLSWKQVSAGRDSQLVEIPFDAVVGMAVDDEGRQRIRTPNGRWLVDDGLLRFKRP